MKKLFIFLVIFGAIAIGLTSMLIRIKQEEHIIQDTVKPIEIEKSHNRINKMRKKKKQLIYGAPLMRMI